MSAQRTDLLEVRTMAATVTIKTGDAETFQPHVTMLAEHSLDEPGFRQAQTATFPLHDFDWFH